MSVPRFTIRKVKCNIGPVEWRDGWAVFDRDLRITIPFANYDEAMQRRDNIHRLYLRYGW